MNRETVLQTLSRIEMPDGGDIVGRDLVRALAIDGATIRFVLEAPDPDTARRMEPVRQAAEAALMALPGVEAAQVVLTAHGPAARAPAPSLKIGGHQTQQLPGQKGPQRVRGIDRILAVASGKGGVGKSTV